MVSPEARTLIDSMSQEELLEEIHRRQRSSFQGDNYAYLKTRFDLLNNQEETNRQEQKMDLAKDANRIAADANSIASEANRTSTKAYRMSVFSVVVAIVAALIALLPQCTTKP